MLSSRLNVNINITFDSLSYSAIWRQHKWHELPASLPSAKVEQPVTGSLKSRLKVSPPLAPPPSPPGRPAGIGALFDQQPPSE